MLPHENLDLQDMEGEVWKPVVGYEQFYHVSNMGRVKSFKKNKPKILKYLNDSRGYYQIAINQNGGKKQVLVHRLVAFAFIDNPLCKKEINHKNGIKTDNRVDNLEWATRSENIKHAYDNGMKNMKGEKNSQAKLNAQSVIEIRHKHNVLNQTINSLASEYGVNRSCISRVLLGKGWSHI